MASDPIRVEINGQPVSAANRFPVDAEVDAATLQAAITAAVAAAGIATQATLANILTALGAGLPAALGANGGVQVEQVADPLTMTHTAVNVNGNTVVLAANANRRYLLIINDSDTLIYLNLGGAAAVNTGIPLVANQLGNYELEAPNIYRGAINANHGGGAVNKRLLVVEGV